MNELKGKKVVFLGDSITAGACASAEDKKYVNVFARTSGAEVFSYGICGTRIARQFKPSPNPEFDRYFASRIDEMNSDADYVFVFGGTNDFGHGDAPLGKLGDVSPDSFYGAVYDLLDKLYNKYPAARIYLVTPLHRSSENDTINEVGIPVKKTFKEIVDAEKKTAELFSVPVIDLYGASNLQPVIPAVKEKFFAPDGLHPNDEGHRRIAEIILRSVLKG